MAQGNFIVRCPQCRAKNRIPQSRLGQTAVCGKCRTTLPQSQGFPEATVNAGDRDFPSEVLNFQGPVFVIFWAPWCGHCARLLPIIDELSSEFAGYIKFVKVEMDKNPGLASQYQVQSVPNMLLFKHGRMVNRFVGALPKYELQHHLRSLL